MSRQAVELTDDLAQSLPRFILEDVSRVNRVLLLSMAEDLNTIGDLLLMPWI